MLTVIVVLIIVQITAILWLIYRITELEYKASRISCDTITLKMLEPWPGRYIGELQRMINRIIPSAAMEEDNYGQILFYTGVYRHGYKIVAEPDPDDGWDRNDEDWEDQPKGLEEPLET